MRNTDPPRLTVVKVRERDGNSCIICGRHVGLTTQHRVARGMGGTYLTWINEPENLLTLCGSGTTGCHGWVEAHPTFAREAGWSVPRTTHPSLVPVLYPEGWTLLDGFTRRLLTAREAAALTIPEQTPRGHTSGSPRGWGLPEHDPDLGSAWPHPEAGDPEAAGALRPWPGA